MALENADPAMALSPFADEAFLLTLTSKGIYNRASRDYESQKENIRLSFEEGKAAAEFEGIRVVLEDPLIKSRCSCPAQGVCKHILMALFAVRDSVQVPPDAEADTDAFAELFHADPEALKKGAGKKCFDEALRELEDGFGALFPALGEIPGNADEAAQSMAGLSMIAAEIPAYGLTVFFPRRNSIAGAVCKCGGQGLCKHKLIGALSFLQLWGLLPEIKNEAFSPESTELLESALSMIQALLEKGFISAGETDREAAIQFSLKFGGMDMGNLSRLFRTLAAGMENMMAKSAEFNPEASFSTASRIYNTAFLLIKRKGDGEKTDQLEEKSRALYRTVPQGTFTGLGAYPWVTQSGYTGVSALLFYHERKAIVTCSSALPDFYDSTREAASLSALASLCREESRWTPPVSLDALSRHAFVLRFCKIALDRLSSSKETRYAPFKETGFSDAEESAPLLPPPGEAEPRDYDYFGGRDSFFYCMVPAGKILSCRYDRVQQKLRFEFGIPSTDYSQPGMIPYREINLPAIRFIEELAKAECFESAWFVCRPQGKECIPLSMIDSRGVHNFYFG